MSVASIVSPDALSAPWGRASLLTNESEVGLASLPNIQTTIASACVQCRSRHLRCDELNPCTCCSSNSFECVYPRAHRDFRSPPNSYTSVNPPKKPDEVTITSSRTAPPITSPPLGIISRAPEPTKGQAWAFPDEEIQRIPSATGPSEDTFSRQMTSFYDNSQRASFAHSFASSNYTVESRLPPSQQQLENTIPSKRASFAHSLASSNYTVESRLPPSQQQLENAIPSAYQWKASSASQMSTHDHNLQHRHSSELQKGDDGPASGFRLYSRTPELRVTHKIRERKRRVEMKDLFDTLRTLHGVDRGAKVSKWEILSKGA